MAARKDHDMPPIESYMEAYRAKLAAERAQAAAELADLTNRLNKAARKAGHAGNYVVERVQDQTDAWADQSGYRVTQGEDRERAYAWLAKATPKGNAPKVVVRHPHGEYLRTHRWNIGH